MKNYTDKELANFMLEKRQNGVPTRWRYFNTNRRHWAFLLGLIVILLALGAWAQRWGFCGLLMGLITGIFYRDGIWLRQQRAVWPLYVKVIDWGKVERIAKGEPPA